MDKTNMFRRIVTLVKLQLSDQINLFAYQTKKRFIANICMRFLLLVAACIGVSVVFRYFVAVTQISIQTNELVTIITVTQILAIIACSTQLIHTLYISNENVVLLSLPVKHNEIFISKLIVFYIYELKRNIYLILPILIGYALTFGKYYGFGFDYYLRVMLLFFIIPLFPVFIGAIISLPLVFIINFVKKRTLLHIVIVLGACLFISITLAISFQNIGRQLTPLEAWGTVLKQVKGFTALFYQQSLYYKLIGNIIYAKDVLVNIAYLIALLVGFIVIIWFVSLPTYFKTATYPFDDINKKRYKTNMEPIENTYYTFLQKELKTFFRSSDQVIGSFLYLIILPFLIYVLNDLYTHLKPSEFGENIILGVNVLLGLVLLLASNISSATAITREGSEFYIMKIVPTLTHRIAWAKITLNVALSTVIIICTSLCLGIVEIINPINVILMGVVFLLVNTAHILWSFEIDLLRPRIHDYMSGQSIDDNPNATKSILIGLLIAMLFAGLTVALVMEDFVTGWIRLIIIALLFLGARIYLFINRVNIYLERIEI